MTRSRYAVAVASLILATSATGFAHPIHASEGGHGNRGAGTDPPGPSELRYEDCEQQIGVFPIDARDARPYLPPGFSPVAFQDSSPAGSSGLPTANGADGTVQLLATTCQNDGVKGRAGEAVTLLQTWIYVDPPPELKEEGINAYVAVPWMVTSSSRQAHNFSAMGIPAEGADVTNAIEQTAGWIGSGTATATSEHVAVNLDTEVPSLIRDTTPERIRLFGVRGTSDEATLTGIVDMYEDEHTHLLIGASRMAVEGAKRFPVAQGPGVAIHVIAGYGVTWKKVSS